RYRFLYYLFCCCCLNTLESIFLPLFYLLQMYCCYALAVPAVRRWQWQLFYWSQPLFFPYCELMLCSRSWQVFLRLLSTQFYGGLVLMAYTIFPAPVAVVVWRCGWKLFVIWNGIILFGVLARLIMWRLASSFHLGTRTTVCCSGFWSGGGYRS